MANGTENGEYLRRGDSLRSSVSQNHRRSSVKNCLLDPVNRRPLYRDGRCVDAAKERDLCLLAERPVRSRRRCWLKLQKQKLEFFWKSCQGGLYACMSAGGTRGTGTWGSDLGGTGTYGCMESRVTTAERTMRASPPETGMIGPGDTGSLNEHDLTFS